MNDFAFSKKMGQPGIKIYKKDDWDYIRVNNLGHYTDGNPDLEKVIQSAIETCLKEIPRPTEELFDEILESTQAVFLKHPDYPNRIIGVSAINVFEYTNTTKHGYILQMLITTIDPDVHGKGAFPFFPIIHTAEYVNSKWIGSHYSCRTYTPRVYGTMYRRLSVHPDLKKQKDNNNLQDLMTSFVDWFYEIADDRFEPETQIFRGVYETRENSEFGSDSMPVRPDREPKFNKWFEENIDYARGDGLLVFSDIGLKEIFFTYFAKISALVRRRNTDESLVELLASD